MIIAINCWVLRNKKLDGIGYFTVNTITNLIRGHPEVHFQILCDKNFTETFFDFENVTKHYLFPALRHPLLYVWYMEIIVARFLKKQKPDIFISADGFLSLASKCKQMPIVYDINFAHQPEDLKFKNRLYYNFFFGKFTRKATRIATISEYSKKDISEFYKIDPGKIDNVGCGINSNFSPLNKDEVTETRKRWSDEKPYFFFVGSMHPRKNIRRLVEAFTLFKANTGSDFKLLLAGSILWRKSEIAASFENSFCKSDIVFTGRLPDDNLRKLMGGACALTFVPTFEGFGLPIVEAMQCGVPVMCSNVTSMPEVAGNAALLVDPFNVESIAKGMEKLYTDSELRGRLIELGHIQKQKFSWDRTARLLWESICKAIA